MKKIILLLTISFSVLTASTQNYNPIKGQLALNLLEKAKTDFDKAITNAKYASNAEAYAQKTSIYAGLSMVEATKSTPAGLKLADEAVTAFQKYREMDPSMEIIKDPVYQNGPINLYSFYYSEGYEDYKKENWEPGYIKLKKAFDFSNVLLTLKVITSPIDTNVLVLAGITAEKSNHMDDAANYYSLLADAKVSGDGFESIYRFLVNHNFTKKNIAAFEKYKLLGAELYPTSEFFTYDRVDFAAGLATGFLEKTKALEEVLATDPTNYKANQIMGELIYDTLNNDDEGAVLPANADELEKIMIASFTKAAETAKNDPKIKNPELSWIYIADHFINKADIKNKQRTTHASEMKARTKPGTMASKEDVAKRDLLDVQYGEILENARDPYGKAAAILAARAKEHNGLEIRDKEQYKKSINYLAEIYAYKRIQSKGKPADVTKYTAEEKKWNELYDTINSIPTLKRDH